MFGTKINNLQNVLTIIDIETNINKLLIFQGIDSVIKMINTKYNIYRSLLEKSNSKFFMVEIDQIFIFQQWHHTDFIRIPNTISHIFYTSSLKRNEIDYVMNKLPRNSRMKLHTRSTKNLHHPWTIMQ